VSVERFGKETVGKVGEDGGRMVPGSLEVGSWEPVPDPARKACKVLAIRLGSGFGKRPLPTKGPGIFAGATFWAGVGGTAVGPAGLAKGDMGTVTTEPTTKRLPSDFFGVDRSNHFSLRLGPSQHTQSGI
jgi:hypothetical protein